MTKQGISRRGLLRGAGLIGCSAAAWPLMTRIALASAPWENRLVVLILRGGMDGLDVVRPVGDPRFARLRPDAGDDAVALGDFYAMHPGLSGLEGLWKAGELAFVHAVSTPYRDRRSHFDGQDILEAGTAGTAGLASVRDGWLNRLLQVVPGIEGETAYAIGRDTMKVLAGPAPVANWAPDARLELSDASKRMLEQAYAGDDLFRASILEALDLAAVMAAAPDSAAEMADGMEAAMRDGGGRSERALAAFAADRLNRDTRIAAFSIGGWDTHRNQAGSIGRPLGKLAEVITTLRSGLGRNWSRTAVVAMTEFGRTARINGTGGTDHGTGGVMVLAGGAVRGGRVFGRWPGLAEADLYARRDLMATGDVRDAAAWVMRGLFGLERSTLEDAVFPGLDMGPDPGLLG